MDFFMRIRKPAMEFTALCLEVAAGIFLSWLMYPLLGYVLAGEWVSVGTLTSRAVAAREWGAFLALQIPLVMAACGLAAVVQGLIRFVKDLRKSLSQENDIFGMKRMF